MVRTTRKTVTFSHPFALAGVNQSLPAGAYEIVTDEELIESLSFPVYRRISTMMIVPVPSHRGAIEMIGIDPVLLAAAQERDAKL